MFWEWPLKLEINGFFKIKNGRSDVWSSLTYLHQISSEAAWHTYLPKNLTSYVNAPLNQLQVHFQKAVLIPNTSSYLKCDKGLWVWVQLEETFVSRTIDTFLRATLWIKLRTYSPTENFYLYHSHSLNSCGSLQLCRLFPKRFYKLKLNFQ